MTEPRQPISEAELGDLIREALQLPAVEECPVPDSRIHPHELIKRCREIAEGSEATDRSANPLSGNVVAEVAEHLPPTPPRETQQTDLNGRYWTHWPRGWFAVLAASLLVIFVGLGGYALWKINQRDETSHPLQAADRLVLAEGPVEVSGAGDPPANRSVALTVPRIAPERFGESGRTYVVSVEFPPSQPPVLSPLWHPVERGGEPVQQSFTRPQTGTTQIVVFLVDRPADEALARRLAAGEAFDSSQGPEAIAEALGLALRADGFHILAYGIHTLNADESAH